MSLNYDEVFFRNSIDKAVKQVKTILGTAKNPRLASDDEDHTYEDKYSLAEFVTNSSIAAQIQVLHRLGLDPQKLQTLLSWVVDDKKTVTLSFRAEDGCSFSHEKIVHPSAAAAARSTGLQMQSNPTVGGGGCAATTTTTTTTTTTPRTKTTRTVVRVVRKVRLCHWKVNVNYAIAAYPGNETASAVELQARSASTVIITSAGVASSSEALKSPIPEYTVHKPIEVNITWLLQSLNREAAGQFQFSINRNLPSCKTPRRNEQVDAALRFGESFRSWSIQVVGFFDSRIEKEILSKHNPLQEPSVRENSLASGTDGESICNLIVPMMENGSVLTPADTGALLDAHSQSINLSCSALTQMFPSSMLAKLATTSEATIVLLCNHARHLVEQYFCSINYIEDMLRKQLIQAIGKEVTAKDFDRFMRFHNQKLFGPLFAPKPFTHAIRRPDHYPDGTLSIESDIDTSNNYIETMVRHIPGKDNPSIFMPINAATSVEITGDRFLHGWIQYQFTEASLHYKLVARARQFSSFLLVVGSMAGRDKFSPKHAIILQNKDEVLIPLLTEVLPTAKEFKDAIASLSPEQQDFAQAYRSMQLESSVFGVCVIQLKPQLEKLLGLPPGALTKEIQLTQDLMSLLVDYQIPSDLLSFDGDAGADMTTKLSAVKGHAKAVMDVIDGAKEKLLIEHERKVEMAQKKALEQERMSKILDEVNSKMDRVCCLMQPAEKPARMSKMMDGVSSGMDRVGCLMQSAKKSVRSKGNATVTASSTAARQEGEVYMKADGKKVRRVKRSAAPASSQSGDMAPALSPVCAVTVAPTSFGDSNTTQFVAENAVKDREGDSVFEMAEDSTAATDRGEPTGEDAFEMVEDFTLVPKKLDAKVERLDADCSLKPAIIKTGEPWTRSRQENLLTRLEKSVLPPDEVEKEKHNAIDMLDAISRSGTLPIECAELHVIVALSHCFENDVMGTAIQDNINPIEKVERSSLIVATTIHNKDCALLLQGSTNTGRLGTRFPALFLE